MPYKDGVRNGIIVLEKGISLLEKAEMNITLVGPDKSARR